MTDGMMSLRSLVEMSADADLLGEMLPEQARTGFVAENLVRL